MEEGEGGWRRMEEGGGGWRTVERQSWGLTVYKNGNQYSAHTQICDCNVFFKFNNIHRHVTIT